MHDLKDSFTYHSANSKQIEAMAAIRSKAFELAELIEYLVPSCPDRSAAIRKIREAIMTANAAIVIPSNYENGLLDVFKR